MGPWGEMADMPTQDFMKMLLLPGVFTLFQNRPLLGGQQDIFIISSEKEGFPQSRFYVWFSPIWRFSSYIPTIFCYILRI